MRRDSRELSLGHRTPRSVSTPIRRHSFGSIFRVWPDDSKHGRGRPCRHRIGFCGTGVPARAVMIDHLDSIAVPVILKTPDTPAVFGNLLRLTGWPPPTHTCTSPGRTFLVPPSEIASTVVKK